MLNTGLAYIVS